MKRQWIRVLGVVVAAGLSVAWAQRGGGSSAGRGGGMSPMAGAGSGAGASSGSASRSHDSGTMPNTTHGSAMSKGSIADRVTANRGLDSKVTALLPAGMNLQDASANFKNMGQFIAALHVCKNLNIPFDKLHAEMTTGGKSLGQAIMDLSPNTTKAAAQTAAKTAESQAKEDMKTPSRT